MGSLVVEPGFFNSERDVVKEELRSRVLAAALRPALLPLSAADLLRRASLCAARHRQHRGSGRRDDRRRARLPRHLLPARQCGAGRRRQFRPGPARPLGRSIFRADRAARRRRSRASPRSSRARTPGAPLHGLRGEHAAARGADRLSRRRRRRDADAAAMEVLDGILSTGESSRLHQSLVYRDQIAAQASSFVDIKQGRGSLAVYAILSRRQDRRGRRGRAAPRDRPLPRRAGQPPPSWPRRRTNC